MVTALIPSLLAFAVLSHCGAVGVEPRRFLAFRTLGDRKESFARPPERIILRVRNPQKSRHVDPVTNNTNSPITHVKPMGRIPSSGMHMNLSSFSSEHLYASLSQMGLNKMASLMREAHLGPLVLENGQMTMFCPTDEAFSLMLPGTLHELMNDASKLRKFLLYHMARDFVRPSDVRNDVTKASLESSLLRFNIYHQGQMVTVSGAQFLDSGRQMSSIWIQPIDRVLHPISRMNLVDRARLSFTKMHEFLVQAGISQQIASGTFTLLAPTQEAFENFPEKAREAIMTNSTLMRRVILSHVVPGTFFSTAFTNGYNLKCLGGDLLTFTTRRGLIMANGIPIVQADIAVTNGVLHALNRVMIPREVAEMCNCMPLYLSSPATLKPPLPPAKPKSEDLPFGHRLKKPHRTSDIFLPGRKIPHTTTALRVDEESPISSFKPEDAQKSIEQFLEDPMDLPTGIRVTFTTANQLFGKTLLIKRLQDSGKPYTILLPTDDAFTNLSPGVVTKLQSDKNLLRRVLSCHLIESRISPNSLRNNARLGTSGGSLVVNVMDGDKIMVGGGRILSVRAATNGVVYVTNRLIYPLPRPTVTEALRDPSIADDISNWLKILSDSGMKTTFAGPNIYTVFVPSNIAFSNFAPHLLEQFFNSKKLLQEFVGSHVIDGAYYTNMLTPGLVLRSINGHKLRFGSFPGGFTVNDVPVLKPAISTGNGVIYIVDSLLSEPLPYRSLSLRPTDGFDTEHGQTLQDIARSHRATSFLHWMQPSGLVDVIQSGGRYTLFLPTDVALGSLSPTLRIALASDPRQRRRIIQYHISPVPVGTVQITNELLLPTLLQRKPIRCNIYHMGNVVTANGGSITAVIPSGNVTIAIVNRTLTPPVGNLLLTISKSPLLRNFTKIIRVAGMEDELKNGGPYTVFAPSKCAFSRIPPEEYETLINDPKTAKDFVLKHLVKGSIYTRGVKEGMQLSSEYPLQMNIKILPNCVAVNEAKIKYGDISATNGVLHILSSAL